MSKSRKTPIYVCATEKQEMLVLTTNEHKVITAIRDKPQTTTTEISEKTGIDVPVLRTILHRMRAASIIESDYFPNGRGQLEHHHSALVKFDIYDVKTF